MAIPDPILCLPAPVAYSLEVVPGESLLRLPVFREAADGPAIPCPGVAAGIVVTRADGVVVVDRALAAMDATGVLRLALTAAETATLAVDGEARGRVLATYAVTLTAGDDRKVAVGGTISHPCVRA